MSLYEKAPVIPELFIFGQTQFDSANSVLARV
jgi:hypothetical protein